MVTEIWVAVLVFVAILVGVITWFASRRGLPQELATLRQSLEAARIEAGRLPGALHEAASFRQSLDSARAEASRLPDALQRAERAETACVALQASNQELASREAALTATLSGTNTRLEEFHATVPQAQARREQLESELTAQRQRTDTTTANLAGVRDQVIQLTKERDHNAQECVALRERVADLAATEAQMRAERDAALAAHEQTKAFLAQAEVKMRTVFLEAASKVFDEKSLVLEQRIKESGETSRQGLEATLKPFAEKVDGFQAKVELFSSEQALNLAKFEGSFSTIQKLNQEMADATNSLSRALKGNAKTRGDWGEMILDTVLKASGLVEGTNYTSQSSTTDDESGKRRSPDVIVNLPDGRKVVVDSKVSLIAWTEANNADTPEQQEEAMLRHTASMRQHLRDLSEKNYPKVLGPDALDLTVMFVPIEGALAAALSTNADLQMEAFDKRIVLTSPNSLMAMLRVIERLWSRDRLQRQVDTIGTQAGKVLDALIDFLSDFEDINTHIGRADKAFKAAKNRLSESNQSVISRSRRLVEAGAKGRKALPEELQSIDGEAILSLPSNDAAALDKSPAEDDPGAPSRSDQFTG